MACRIVRALVRKATCQAVRTDSKALSLEPRALVVGNFAASGPVVRTAPPEGLEQFETAKNCVVGASDLSHLEKQRSGISSLTAWVFVQRVR